jgi:hypothetical protein
VGVTCGVVALKVLVTGTSYPCILTAIWVGVNH